MVQRECKVDGVGQIGATTAITVASANVVLRQVVNGSLKAATQQQQLDKDTRGQDGNTDGSEKGCPVYVRARGVLLCWFHYLKVLLRVAVAWVKVACSKLENDSSQVINGEHCRHGRLAQRGTTGS